MLKSENWYWSNWGQPVASLGTSDAYFYL